MVWGGGGVSSPVLFPFELLPWPPRGCQSFPVVPKAKLSYENFRSGMASLVTLISRTLLPGMPLGSHLCQLFTSLHVSLQSS